LISVKGVSRGAQKDKVSIYAEDKGIGADISDKNKRLRRETKWV
jgi:hypothetical protein